MNISRAYVELRMIARVYTQGKLQLSCQPSDSKTIYSTDVLIRCQFPPNKKTNHGFFIKKNKSPVYSSGYILPSPNASGNKNARPCPVYGIYARELINLLAK